MPRLLLVPHFTQRQTCAYKSQQVTLLFSCEVLDSLDRLSRLLKTVRVKAGECGQRQYTSPKFGLNKTQPIWLNSQCVSGFLNEPKSVFWTCSDLSEFAPSKKMRAPNFNID